MRYFLLDGVGGVQNEDYCFTDNPPKGVLTAYDLKVAKRVAEKYPKGDRDYHCRECCLPPSYAERPICSE